MLYKKMGKQIVLLGMTIISLVLTGCQSEKVYHQTDGNIADVTQRVVDARKKSDEAAKPVPALVMNQGLYVDDTPISLTKQPSWLKKRIVLRGENLPFSYYSRTIVGGGNRNVLTRYQVGLDSSAKVSMNYTGTVRGALDLLAAKSGYVYSVNGNDVYWQAFITKTFDIAFMPGSSNYLMGGTGSDSSGAAASASSAGSSGGVTQSFTNDNTSQYSNLKGTLSIWNDLNKTVSQLLSPDGKIMVSEATTSITVRDKPTNVDLVSKYIANLNQNLAKQVLVKIQVLEVTLNQDYNYGINWNIVQRAFGGGNYVLNSSAGEPVSISTLNALGIPQIGIDASSSLQNNGTGVTALINALTEQGRVSVVSEPRVVCLNNQVSVVRIVSQQGYLASIQNTSTPGSSGGTPGASSTSVTSQITPGTLITGLTLYVLPKILGKKVFLQVNADLSNSLGFDLISSTQGPITQQPAAASNGSVIQVPKVTDKQFNQRSVIGSGDTLILSGFRKISNQTGAKQLFDQQSLGGKGAIQNNSETIVLITPIILHGYA